MMNGGLGNQLFQYIFFRFIEEHTKDVCYIDNRAFFYSKQHNGYEIEKIFNLKPNLLSDFFEPDVWTEILEMTKKQTNIVELLRNNGLDLEIICEANLYQTTTNYTGSFHSFPINHFDKNIINLQGNVYYFGYWINANWFKSIKDIILKELTFPPLNDNYNKSLMNTIDSNCSVGVHIRRGDFIDIGWALPLDWYFQTMKVFKQKLINPVFIVFSDDVSWCRENSSKLGFNSKDKLIFCEGNTAGNNFIDMHLMSKCKHLVIANSSFSYLAALLNQNENKIVANPVSGREIL